MSCKKLCVPALVAAFGLIAVVGSNAIADKAKDTKSAGQPEFKLPPGWTAEDMKACMVAGTPGEMHKHLAKGVGDWEGKGTMWMSPGAEPIKSESQLKGTSIMDGRYVKCEMSGECPLMGPMKGLGIYGYDNVGGKFQCTWIDNHGTGMMIGTGELSGDGKTINWTFTASCPITQKPTTMREVETITGPNTKTLEMFASDPKSGKEFKMMKLELTKKEGVAQAAR